MIWLKEMDMFEEALKESTGIDQHYMIMDIETVNKKAHSGATKYIPGHIINDFILLGGQTNELYKVRHIHRFCDDVDDEAIVDVQAI